MDGRVGDVVDWWKGLRDFPFFNMVEFFKGSDSGLSVISFCGSKDWRRGMEDSGVGNGVGIGSTRSGVVKVVVHGYDMEVKVREKRRVLIKVCKAGQGDKRE